MSDSKNSFVLYKDWMQTVTEGVKDGDVSLEDAGRLFCIISEYQQTGQVETPIPKTLKLIVNNLLKTFARDAEKWQETREKRAVSGKNGGLAKASKSKQMLASASKPSKCYNDLANLAVTVTGTVTDTVTGTGIVTGEEGIYEQHEKERQRQMEILSKFPLRPIEVPN